MKNVLSASVCTLLCRVALPSAPLRSVGWGLCLLRSCDKATPHQNKKELRIKPCARWLHSFIRFLFFARLCPPPPFPLSRSRSATPQKDAGIHSVVFYCGRLPQQNTTSEQSGRRSLQSPAAVQSLSTLGEEAKRIPFNKRVQSSQADRPLPPPHGHPPYPCFFPLQLVLKISGMV